MKHQFIGGPLDGKVKFFVTDEEATSVPWEEYVRRAEVDDILVWDHRSRVSSPVEVGLSLAGAHEETLSSPENITYFPPQEPADGGYSAVAAAQAGSKEHLRAMQLDAESRIKRSAIEERLAARSEMTQDAPTDQGAGDQSTDLPGASDRITRDMEERGVEARIDVTSGLSGHMGPNGDDPEVAHGDPGTLPGEFDFKEARKKIGFQMWQWFKGQVIPDGSSTLGKALEEGTVTDRQVNALKKLGVEVNSPEDVYKLAENWARANGA